VFQPDFFSRVNTNEMTEKFENQSWSTATSEKKDNIQRYFNLEVSNAYSSNNQHNYRVKEMMMRIFNINYVKSI
jgi:predicted GTPase